MTTTNLHDTPAYWENLGIFVQAFAMVERNFTAATLVLVDSDFSVSAPIVKNFSTVERRIDLVKQLFPVKRKKPDLIADCERVLSQMKVIQEVRNLLLHNGTLFSDADEATTAKMMATPGENSKQVQLSVEIFQAMADDCKRIAHYWYLHAWNSPSLAAPEYETWRPELNKPWSYTKSGT